MAKTLAVGPLVTSDGDFVQLTTAGSDRLALAQRLIHAFDEFKRPPHDIRFTAYPSQAAAAARIVAKFSARHTDLKVVFHDVTDRHRGDQGTQMLQEVVDGVADVAIAPSGRSHRTLFEEDLYTWTLRVILPEENDLNKAQHVSLSQLLDLTFIVSPHGHMSREQFEALAREMSRPPQIAMELINENVIEEITKSSNLYAAVMPDDAFGRPDPTLGPALLSSKRKPISGRYSLYYRRRAATDGAIERERKGLAAALAKEIAKNWKQGSSGRRRQRSHK
jgi:DNA-binding transcriptional LysR family regulator